MVKSGLRRGRILRHGVRCRGFQTICISSRVSSVHSDHESTVRGRLLFPCCRQRIVSCIADTPGTAAGCDRHVFASAGYCRCEYRKIATTLADSATGNNPRMAMPGMSGDCGDTAVLHLQMVTVIGCNTSHADRDCRRICTARVAELCNVDWVFLSADSDCVTGNRGGLSGTGYSTSIQYSGRGLSGTCGMALADGDRAGGPLRMVPLLRSPASL